VQLEAREVAVFIACSTVCFAKYSLEQAFRTIAELEFNKVDVAIHEGGKQLRPSDVAADVNAAAQRLRLGTGITPAAFDVEIDAAGEEECYRQIRAICRLARISTVPLITVPAAAAGSQLDREVLRLTKLVALAEAEGILLTVATRTGTLTEDPVAAVELCQRVPGLGLTLDPSHYICGPHADNSIDQVMKYVYHTRLRDTSREAMQVRVGQGLVEYGRLVTQLTMFHYNRALCVDISPLPDVDQMAEMRKMRLLLESLL